MTDTTLFSNMVVDHVELFVGDLAAARKWLVEGYGFVILSASETTEARSAVLGQGTIRLVLTQPLVDDHPGRAYLDEHGDGVGDIALRVADATAAYETALRRGARSVARPATRDGVTTASIIGFGDVTHTFVQRPGGPIPPVPAAPGVDPGLTGLDHVAVCLEAGQLEPTVEFYRTVLDFALAFEERIVIGAQAMESKVVVSDTRAVALTLLEPDVSLQPGQIDEFLKQHGGPGVQHLAFASADIVEAVGTIAAQGVEFLPTPGTYYDRLPERLRLARHTTEEMRRLNVLADQDHDGQLYQIFARSTHPRRTFFLEIIERFGARTFGSGNIKALYEAVETQRATGDVL